MKTKFKYITMAVAMASALGLSSCQDVLEEQPRGAFEPSHFGSADGINGALTGLYQNLRYLYGNMYYYQSLETGTDEYTYAQSADGNWKDADMSGVGNVTASSMRSDALWANAFRNINTCNQIIELAKTSDLDAKLLGEVHFFRAFYYFNLVQTFGGVPLDLGSGELMPNTTTSRSSVRNTVPEVYKVVFDDLKYAIENLPDAPRYQGTVAKNTARLTLAKAYLTFAWWLENPKGLETYPACQRAAADGKSAKDYFQLAYNVAVEGIENPGPFKLMETYRDVFLAQNDRINTEHLLFTDHTEADGFYNGGDLGYAGGNGTENTTAWASTWNYTNIRAYCVDAEGKEIQFDPLGREAAQEYGRPWTRMCPTHEALAYFTDRDVDSRFDGSFVSAFHGNWERNGKKNETAYINKEEKLAIEKGGVVLLFTDENTGDVTYPTGNLGESNVGAGYKAGTAYWIIEPNMVSRLAHPMLWKYGTYRTDNNGGMGSPNGAITRPFPIMRFAELYLVAAEAAVKGATGTMSAADLIKVIRDRAGKWNFDKMTNKAVTLEDKGLTTPSAVDLDYVLDERAREFFGEGMRWYDLARTQTWEERAGQYHIVDIKDGAYNDLKEINRKIEKHFYLRPIPQGQLDAMEMTYDEKVKYQNPGYDVAAQKN